MDADRKVAVIAATQHGTIHYEQLLAAGLTPSMIRHRIRRGWLHRLHRGVYAVGHLALPPLGREAAALLACGPGAALAHRSAAALWALMEAPPGVVDVAVPPGRHPAHRGIAVHRPAALDDGDVRVVEGLRVTSPRRTVFDLPPALPTRELERVVAEVQARRLVSADELAGGPPRVRDLVTGGPTLTRSEAERRFLSLVRRAGLPVPEANVRVAGLEVDFLWRRERVVVEIDGYAFHGHRGAFERDRRRDRALRQAGFVPIRVTWRQLEGEPEAVVADVATNLARAA